jgi:hypothetical protein
MLSAMLAPLILEVYLQNQTQSLALAFVANNKHTRLGSLFHSLILGLWIYFGKVRLLVFKNKYLKTF